MCGKIKCDQRIKTKVSVKILCALAYDTRRSYAENNMQYLQE